MTQFDPVRSVSEKSRTPGETLFEQYLASQGLPFEFEKEHVGRSKRPDYTLQWKEKAILLDVKDFDPPENLPKGGAYDPYIQIREKINQGRDKFREFKEHCCVLVLRNLGHPLVSLHEPYVMLGAMYGDSGFTIPLNTTTGIANTNRMERAFLDRGKMIRRNSSRYQNTTISAFVTLSSIRPHYQMLEDAFLAGKARSFEKCVTALRQTVSDFDLNWEVPRVVVWHNAVARIPFPSDLFRGPYDTHIGNASDGDDYVKPTVTYRGRLIPQSVKI